ncbi:hypothetical protein G4228_006327 [Cervus hanglu yarkandensis]|nr:hypothetical protein G4228_006327 [Cervus hanglu yarkandensis]
MKGFLFAGIIVVLTVAAVESQYHTLHCVQCNSLKDGCIAKNAMECPSNANTSCTSFSTNFSQETTTLVLKGCSNVSNSTCEFLGVANQMFRGITFRKFECGDNSSTPTTTSPTSTTSDTVAQASFTPLALASILLLRLLL